MRYITGFTAPAPRQQSPLSSETGNADKRSFSAGSGASSLSKQLQLTEQTKAPSRQLSGNSTKNVATVAVPSEGQNRPCLAAGATARGCCRTEQENTEFILWNTFSITAGTGVGASSQQQEFSSQM